MSSLNFFLTWWGAIVLGALDASIIFFMPFGTDAVLVYLSARDRSLFWLYPLLITAGSVAGAAVTYQVGAKVGDKGLPRFVPERRLERLRKRVRNVGPFTLGVTAALPPPFPLTAFILTSGALRVAMRRFLLVFAVARVIRFGIEATLAQRYGTSVLRLVESDTAQQIVIGLVIVSVVGTAFTIIQVWRGTSRSR